MKKLLLFIVHHYEKTAPLCLEYGLFCRYPTFKDEKKLKIKDGPQRQGLFLRINLVSKK
jgi:hypothetical protein